MSGKVYFIRSPKSDSIKVGFSTDPDRRLAGLQTAHGHALELIGAVEGSRAFERHLHKVLKDYRLAGEWFQDVTEVTNCIGRVMDGERFGFVDAPKQDASSYIQQCQECAEHIKKCYAFLYGLPPDANEWPEYLWHIPSSTIWKFCYRPTEPLCGEYTKLLSGALTASTFLAEHAEECISEDSMRFSEWKVQTSKSELSDHNRFIRIMAAREKLRETLDGELGLKTAGEKFGFMPTDALVNEED